jgi:hypothetical protein
MLASAPLHDFPGFDLLPATDTEMKISANGRWPGG